MKYTLIAVLLAILSAASFGQVINTHHIAISGNSIAQMQGGFQRYEFPTIPPQNITIFGQYSFTCSQLLPLIPYMVPAAADIVILYDATTDVSRGTAPADHIACMEQTIALLKGRNGRVHIILANVPPWTIDNCNGDYRDSIDAYNAAYASEPWPSSVQVIDVWTPNILQDGSRWADPNDINGACGIHPGPANQWTYSWQHFTIPAVQAALAIR